MNARNVFRSLVLFVGAFALSCGGGGRDEIAPALIIQTNTLSPTVTIDTFETIEGTQIFGEGVGPGPFSTCGHILSISAYRTETDLVFRIEDEFGFCWDSDIYSIWITGITWRKVPSTLILANNGSPEVNENGLALFRSAGGQGSDPKVPARQWIDDPTDGFFYISIPLDVFRSSTSTWMTGTARSPCTRSSTGSPRTSPTR